MDKASIYGDIAKRTGGDIYVGVVGPVRTGKSTFIHRFLDEVVLPNIENEYDRERTLDEIPQSAGGKTVMTTEPKFVPDEAVRIRMSDETELNVKLIDCVGYMVDGALGAEEEGVPRMIMTPWSEVAMPFEEAAELGTAKVIGEHSTIGMLVTTGGSITDLPREAYVAAEERVARELSERKKPFAIVLNSAHPESESAKALAAELEEKYGVPVALVSCMDLNGDDVREILALVLGEFPLRELKFTLPEWTLALPREHAVMTGVIEKISAFSDGCEKLGDVARSIKSTEGIEVVRLDAGDGTGALSIPLSKDIYFDTLTDMSGIELHSEREMFEAVTSLAKTKKRFDRIASALDSAEENGWGIVMPSAEDMSLEEPRTVKQGAGYGVKLTAHAEAIQMVKTGIKAEVCPVVSSQDQADDVVRRLTEEYEAAPEKIWEANIFGQSLYELVAVDMNGKLANIPSEARAKLGETIERIINEGANGLICILV